MQSVPNSKNVKTENVILIERGLLFPSIQIRLCRARVKRYNGYVQ